jgi:peptidyl-prolyl cis-trans isomerase SurA
MTFHIPHGTLSLHRIAVLLILALVSAACGRSSPTEAGPPPVPSGTWAVVNGETITRDEVDREYRRLGDGTQTLSTEEELTAKLSLLSDLIVQHLLLARARDLMIEVPASELEAAYDQTRQSLSADAYQQELTKRNLTADDIRDGIRREMLAQRVVDREVGEKVSVTDQEIADFFEVNRAQFNFPEDAYRVAQIVITPDREPQITNRTGDDATSPEAAKAKAAMLMERLRSGASFEDLAADYSEDPETAPRGGDLGFVPVSALRQAPPQLRDAVLKAQPGDVRLVSQDGAHTVVFVAAYERAGQRDLSTPGVREQIAQALRGRKERLLRAAYLTALTTDADVANHLARRLVEGQGKLLGGS